MTTHRLALSSLVVEPRIQSRSQHLDPTVVNRYRATIKAHEHDPKRIPFPPVLVARLSGPDAKATATGSERPQLYLVDGFHRYAAHEVEGVETIAAQVVDVGSIADALWLAAKGNLQHGKQLSNKDLREAFQRFIRARKHLEASPNASSKVIEQRVRPNVMTLGEIGVEIGKTKETIRVWMEKDFPKEYHRLYCRDREEPSEGWQTTDLSNPPSRAPTRLERVSLSLENVQRVLAEPSSAAERKQLVKCLAEALAEVTLQNTSTKEAALSLLLDDALRGPRRVVVRVCEEQG
jgi:hypothetical protein